MRIGLSEEKGLEGRFPLTPIQRWFFERNLKNVHHFNQSVLLEVSKEVSLAMLKAIFQIVVWYHDILRVRFVRTPRGYEQIYTGEPEVFVYEKSMPLKEIARHANTVQKSLNIFEGPLLKIVLYHCSDSAKNRLLIVAHHLVIDGVSWRILIDDIESIYNAFLDNGKIAFPAKTCSYRQWEEALAAYAHSEAGNNEGSYWKKVEDTVFETFLPSDVDHGNRDSQESFIIRLNQEDTDKLIRETPRKYDSRINDVLVTALVLAVGDMTGNYRCSFTLEGHGRESVIGLDVSRTIGWFTSMFPVFVEINDSNDLLGSVREVKELLGQIPHKGVGYGILRYYTNSIKRSLPKIGFNYLGQLDSGITEERVFQYAQESVGEEVDKKNSSYNVIDMNGWVKKTVFEMEFSYKVNLYKECTVREFADLFKERLLSIILG